MWPKLGTPLQGYDISLSKNSHLSAFCNRADPFIFASRGRGCDWQELLHSIIQSWRPSSWALNVLHATPARLDPCSNLKMLFRWLTLPTSPLHSCQCSLCFCNNCKLNLILNLKPMLKCCGNQINILFGMRNSSSYWWFQQIKAT